MVSSPKKPPLSSMILERFSAAKMEVEQSTIEVDPSALEVPVRDGLGKIADGKDGGEGEGEVERRGKIGSISSSAGSGIVKRGIWCLRIAVAEDGMIG